jgi:hypothetical protein
VVISKFVDALARLAKTNRDAVREAGGISPLVTLLRSAKMEIKAVVATVLRDLAAENAANRQAILKAGGLQELVEMVRHDATVPVGGEAAGALRSLSSFFPAGCSAIIEAHGVEALVAMVERHREHASSSAIQATGVLANLAQADSAHCEAILAAGGVAQLVLLLSRAATFGGADARRLSVERRARLEKVAEEVANALGQLAAKAPACTAAIRAAGAVAPLVDVLLRSGLNSATAELAARAIEHLVRTDEGSKMSALDALAKRAADDKFDGHGWSLTFPILRNLLQGAAERLLAREEAGSSPSGIQHAIEIGRAVELPSRRLDEARRAFDEAQAREKREKLSSQAEARRKAKEDELALRAAEKEAKELAAREAADAEAAERDAAAQQQTGSKVRRKERLAHELSSAGASSAGASSASSGPRAHPLLSLPVGSPTKGSRRASAPADGYGQASSRGSRGMTPVKGAESSRVRRPASAKRAVKGSRPGGWATERPSAEAEYVPRAQLLLEKIERIASLNQASLPPHKPPPRAVPTEEKLTWHNRWEAKFD